VPSDRIRVAVLYGGRSSEHSISCVSAGGILRALDPDRYEAVAIGITADGAWYRQNGDPEELRIHDGVLPVVVANDQPVDLSAQPHRVRGLAGGVDVVFPVLHGPWGEDGTVQGLLEMAGIAYVGSGVLASALAMDKGPMKQMLQAAGLLIAPFTVISDRDWHMDRAGALARAQELGLPSFVKPSRAGSSLGIAKVSRIEALEPAIEAARKHDPRVIVEAAVSGAREIECGVLTDGHGRPVASRCAEIIVRGAHEFYDFQAKYLDDAADLILPADLDPAVEDEVRKQATIAFEALGCEGLARVDFFIDASGSVIVNEVNTMPGFTPISMFPRMWQETGWTYAGIVEHLIQDALRRGTGLR
jgi:D-alanine-D-alanine ligase